MNHQISAKELSNVPSNDLEIKAKLLCEGFNADDRATQLFAAQNPSNAKRGGLSSGGKMKLTNGLFVNAPLYHSRKTKFKATAIDKNLISLQHECPDQKDKFIQLTTAEVLPAPNWYEEMVGDLRITQIVTAHNKQLASAVFEECALFKSGKACKFCVINYSLEKKDPRLVIKSPELYLAALEKIPVHEYGGLTLNGGLTPKPGRGIELIEPVVRAVHAQYPDLPIAVEITPPSDLSWIDRLGDAGCSSLMMNLEMWDNTLRAECISGKNELCPRDQYLRAFEHGAKVLGPGRISSCFVVGTEPLESLYTGIDVITRMGIIPSPLAGRYFEDVPNYPFKPNVNWKDFLAVLEYVNTALQQNSVHSTDRAGCVACRMCDLILDMNNPT